MPLVLHVAQSSEYGLGKYMLDLVSAQAAAGWPIHVAGHPDSSLRPRAIASGAVWHDWVATRNPGPSLPTEIKTFRSLLRSEAPDVVHLHSSKAGLVGRLVVRRATPTIFQPHGWSFFAMGGPRRAAAVRWERVATRWADAVLCVSHGEREVGESAGIRGRWCVVPTGVDSVRFNPGDRSAARLELGLDDGPMAICAGRLAVGQKGQDVLLRAWPRVVRSIPDAKLVILGDGPDRALLERMAPPSVRFAGGRDDIERWFQAANVVVQPSRYEGFSMTVLEALASARSVVTTDSVGMRESVDDAGAVVAIDDVEAIATALVERLGDVGAADAEGARGRARVMEEFDPDRWRASMLAATLELANR